MAASIFSTHVDLTYTAMSRLLDCDQIPIICICNDVTLPKMRTLGQYCLQLRFRRPEARTVAAKLRTIAFRY